MGSVIKVMSKDTVRVAAETNNKVPENGFSLVCNSLLKYQITLSVFCFSLFYTKCKIGIPISKNLKMFKWLRTSTNCSSFHIT